MTVVLMICAVPPQGSPFVTIAADSLAVEVGNGKRDERAKKIFDAGNALMSTSGGAWDEFREELADVLKENQESSLHVKLEGILKIKQEAREREKELEMIVGLVQFDENGNPQMGASILNEVKGDRVLGPQTYDKNTPMVEHIYFGETRTPEINALRDELQVKMSSGKIRPSVIEGHAKWFIQKVSRIYPESVNGIVQTKTIRFKSN